VDYKYKQQTKVAIREIPASRLFIAGQIEPQEVVPPPKSTAFNAVTLLFDCMTKKKKGGGKRIKSKNMHSNNIKILAFHM
jgi:hypothetical protein